MLQNTHDQSQTFLQYLTLNGDGTRWPCFWFGPIPACAVMFIATWFHINLALVSHICLRGTAQSYPQISYFLHRCLDGSNFSIPIPISHCFIVYILLNPGFIYPRSSLVIFSSVKFSTIPTVYTYCSLSCCRWITAKPPTRKLHRWPAAGYIFSTPIIPVVFTTTFHMELSSALLVLGQAARVEMFVSFRVRTSDWAGGGGESNSNKIRSSKAGGKERQWEGIWLW